MKTILVIENDAPLRTEILEWLALEGFKGVGAQNGLTGIKRGRHILPDLIVCDLLMPELNGFGVISELRKEQETAAIPVILLTGRTGENLKRRGNELGAVDYITKPFAFTDLLKAIRSQLG